ncbi:MAG: hypothetical protein JSR93_04280 [Verrucomicrobia bacterium]|nr:hypothetical protein [Verrucomicrobiota bacterium]
MSFLKTSFDDAMAVFSLYDFAGDGSTDCTQTEKMSESSYDVDDRISLSQPTVRIASSSYSRCSRQSISDSLGGYDVDDRISLSQPTVGTTCSSSSSSFSLSMSDSLGGYDVDDRISYPLSSEMQIPKSQGCLSNCQTDKRSEKAASVSMALLSSDHVLRMEGAEGYAPLDPVMNRFKRSEVFSRLKETDYVKILQVFYRHSASVRTDSWAVEVLDLLITYFGNMSIQPLGNGSNSGVFIMEQNGSGENNVLRLFPISKLYSPDQSKDYRLNKNRVGGEWLSMVIEHPNVAANSHMTCYPFLVHSEREKSVFLTCYPFLVHSEREKSVFSANLDLFQIGKKFFRSFTS